MFLIEVIPIARLPRFLPQSFSYFSQTPVPEGAVVEITVQNRKLIGIVTRSAPVKAVKQHLRSASFVVRKINRIISEHPILNRRDIELLNWLTRQYLASPATVLKLLLPAYVTRRLNFADWEERREIEKEEEQETRVILGEDFESHYVKLALETLKKGTQALIVSPEVTRSEMVLETLKDTVPGDRLWHVTTERSPKELERIWHALRKGEAGVVAGTRAALFFPYQSLSHIAVDDDAAPSHKSWDQMPRYHAREVAGMLHQLHGGELTLTGNPPSLETYETTREGNEARLVLLREDRPDPVSIFVDMQKEMKEAGGFVTIAQVVKDKLRAVVEEGRRAFLFVNRKGFAPFILCQQCRHVFRCRNCSVPLVLHLQESLKEPTLLCHQCSAKNPAPDTCPVCGSHTLKGYGIGIERVLKEIAELFPEAHLIGLQALEREKKTGLKKLKTALEADSYIAVGTEFALSALRLPPVDLAAIISVDTALSLPDYAQNERLFRTLSQIRRVAKKHFILQSYAKEPELLQDLFHGTFQHFAEKELKERRRYEYPPFSELVKLTVADENREEALKKIKLLFQHLKSFERNLGETALEISNPYPAYIEKKKGSFIFHILIKILDLKERETIKESVGRLLDPDVAIDVGPLTLL